MLFLIKKENAHRDAIHCIFTLILYKLQFDIANEVHSEAAFTANKMEV